MGELTHTNRRGEAAMVDVADKAETRRTAVAEARLRMQPDTLAQLLEGGVAKGDALAVARVAGIQAAKRCAELIPLCHPLPLNLVSVDFAPAAQDALTVTAECRVRGRTGVEMEAMTAASIAALTLYDMCKGIDRSMVVEEVRLLRKEGGRSGLWQRGEGCRR